MIVTLLNRARPLVISSTSPSIRMPSSASPVRLRNGSTATRGIAPAGAPARARRGDGEQVAAAGYGPHDLAPLVADGAAQVTHRLGQRVLGHGDARPDRVEQLVLGDDAADVAGEMAEQAECLGADRHQRAAARERAAIEIKPELPDLEALRPLRHRRSPRRQHAASDGLPGAKSRTAASPAPRPPAPPGARPAAGTPPRRGAAHRRTGRAAPRPPPRPPASRGRPAGRASRPSSGHGHRSGASSFPPVMPQASPLRRAKSGERGEIALMFRRCSATACRADPLARILLPFAAALPVRRSPWTSKPKSPGTTPIPT